MDVGCVYVCSIARDPECPDACHRVGSARTLEKMGVDNLQLKWPNDLLAGGHKLGGILLDSKASRGSELTVVCGLGINVNLANDAKIRQLATEDSNPEPVDLRRLLREPPHMPALAAAMIGSLVSTVQRYVDGGFSSFAEEWSERDWLSGRRIVVRQQQQVREGVAEGIAANGALILRDGEGSHHIVSGTVRLAGDAGAGE